mgnify:CR=1 FL=1
MKAKRILCRAHLKTTGVSSIKDAGAGTDFAYSRDAIFRPDRGSYHQSNIGFMRYDLTGLQDPSGIWAGFGPAPVITATQNDLLWAEALIRTGDLAGGVTLLVYAIHREDPVFIVGQVTGLGGDFRRLPFVRREVREAERHGVPVAA